MPSVAGMPAERRTELIEGLRGIDAVFTPADRETIRFFKARGFRVFLTANAFGGTEAWRQFHDARPVLADGRRLGEPPGSATASPGAPAATDQAALADESIHGGVCPTHEGWRAARLHEIGDWLSRFSRPDDRIDGIWLDFIRYPGLWENKGTAPLFIPDTCYCPRCLAKFSRDTGITMPVKPDRAVDAAAWLRQYRPYEWMSWKKEQINSFAREVRALIENRRTTPLFSPEKNKDAVPLFLGAFVVPWTKGEKDGAASFLLGQDAFALSEIVDVISPMVYHRMVGRDATWVGEMTEYYGEQVRCIVWPIIQAEETAVVEFSEAIRYAGLGGADGLLVYAHRGMDEGKRQALAAFKPPENLIPNPAFKKWRESVPISGKGAGIVDQRRDAAAGPSGSPGQRSSVSAAPPGATAAAPAPNKPPVKNRDAVPLLPKKGAPAAAKARQGNKTPAETGTSSPVSSWPESWSVKEEGFGTAYGPRYELVPAGDLLPGKNMGTSPLFLAARGGTEGYAEWRAPLPVCEQGQAYRLSSLFHRDTWNELSYSFASVWGQRYLLEKHSAPRVFQPLRVKVICPQTPADAFFRFTNEAPSDYFYLAEPKLVRGLPLPAPAPAPNDGFFYPGFFPIGVYGAGIDDLDEIRKLALNTAIIGGEGEPLKRAVLECRRRGLRYVLSPPQDPERLKVYLDRLAELPVTADDIQLAFHVDDEPEMRAVPAGRAEDIQRLVKGRFPRASTGMATVRPSYSREYLRASDFFMIDNYPFPDMPMSWLGDSMDRAAEEAGRDRLLSVIQAFSDGVYWPSLPGWRQIDCLAFLSIVHGSRGIFFYTWSVIGKTAEGRANLGRVVGRLNRIYPWLLEKNLPAPVVVEMLSEHRVDPKGRPGVHAALKKKGEEIMLIAVNTLGAPVEARLTFENRGTAPLFSVEVFSGGVWPVREGSIRTSLQAYETKAFILKNK